MPSNVSWYVFVGAVGLVVAVIAIAAMQTKDWQKNAFLKFANRVDLLISDPIITAAVTRRLRRDSTAAAVGALSGIAIAAIVWVLNPSIPPRTFLYLISFPVVLVGGTVLPVVCSLRDQLYAYDSRAPRVARTMQVEVRDYISPLRFWGAHVLTFVAVLLGIIGVIFSATGVVDGARFMRSLAPVAVLVAISVLIIGWLVARLVVHRNQSATDPLELAWSDALRAETLRTLWLFVTVIAWLAIVFIGLEILDVFDVPIGRDGVGVILNISSVWGTLILNRIFTYGSAYSYFRYRLWPDLGDVGEIVDDSDENADDTEAAEHRP